MSAVRSRPVMPQRFEYRNPKALAAARGRDCTLRIPGWCTSNPETTVACHANTSAAGKGMSIKAGDNAIAFGCAGCHRWLDTGPASADEKTIEFHRAMLETQTILFREGVFR